jgi:hypothetical protein
MTFDNRNAAVIKRDSDIYHYIVQAMLVYAVYHKNVNLNFREYPGSALVFSEFEVQNGVIDVYDPHPDFWKAFEVETRKPSKKKREEKNRYSQNNEVSVVKIISISDLPPEFIKMIDKVYKIIEEKVNSLP